MSRSLLTHSRLLPRNFPSSLRFDGDNDFIELSESDLGAEAAFTLCFFVKFAATNVQQALLNIGSVSVGYTALYLLTPGQLRLSLAGGTAGMTYKGNTQIAPHRWYFIALAKNAHPTTGSRDANDFGYLNIVPVGMNPGNNDTISTVAIGGGSITTNRLNLGVTGSSNQVNDLNAFIADYMIFNRVLTPSEWKNIYLKGQIPSNLYLRWKLNENTGIVANDTSGNNRNGAITTAHWTTDVPMMTRGTATHRRALLPKVRDTFTRADSGITLGATELGNLAYTAITGVWGISNNEAYVPAGTTDSLVVVESGKSNCVIEVMIAHYAAQPGIYFRYADINNMWRVIISGTTMFLQKWVNGVKTSLITTAIVGIDGDRLKVELADNEIKVYLNNNLVIATKDTDNQANTKHGFGFGASSNAVRFDDFMIYY